MILIVEDDPDIVSALERGLAAEGYGTVAASRVEEGLARLREDPVRAAIVDVMIGEESGLDLVRAARAEGIRKPLLMLSALSEVEDRAQGIAAGADDYIVKPFSFAELLARLKVRELTSAAAALTLDPETRTVRAGAAEANLTEREFQVFELLFTHRNRALSRYEIFDALWAPEGAADPNVVDVYIGYLRRKLAGAPGLGVETKTLRNKGYQLHRD